MNPYKLALGLEEKQENPGSHRNKVALGIESVELRKGEKEGITCGCRLELDFWCLVLTIPTKSERRFPRLNDSAFGVCSLQQLFVMVAELGGAVQTGILRSLPFLYYLPYHNP